MGEATVDMNGAEVPEQLEREVDNIRENLDGILGEFERRWQSATDWRAHLKKHGTLIAVAGASSIVALGVGALLVRWRMRAGNSPVEKAYRLRDAVSRVLDHPELVAQSSPGLITQVIAAAAGAAAASATKIALTKLAATSGLVHIASPPSKAPN